MAIWGALAKGAIGAVKGGAKKIAANKLLVEVRKNHKNLNRVQSKKRVEHLLFVLLHL